MVDLNGALQTLRHILGDQCDSFTSGLGSCYEFGRLPGAKSSSERCCVNCIAHRYLTCGEVPPEDKEIDHHGNHQAAVKSDLGKNESIDNVLLNFCAEVSSKTNGVVAIKTARLFDVDDDGNPPEGCDAQFEAIVATTVSKDGTESDDFCVLAEVWREAENSLCTIICEGFEFICNDEEALLLALREMYCSEAAQQKIKILRGSSKGGRRANWRGRPI